MKTCSKCGEHKPLVEFFKKADNKDGHMSACKYCSALRVAEWKMSNSKESRAQNREQKREQSHKEDSDFHRGVKTCNKCCVSKPIDEFSKKPSGKYGLQPKCKSCASIEHSEMRRTDPDKVRARENAWQKANPETVKRMVAAYRKANPESVAAAAAAWSAANPNKRKGYMSKWQKANLHVTAAASARRRSAKLCRTPAWLSECEKAEISKCYEVASTYTHLFGVPTHVDHIIPLRGETVSGLHVPWNLRITLVLANMSKGNTFQQCDATSPTLHFEDAVLGVASAQVR